MRPSERPTARPCAASKRYACASAMASMFVVVPASIALPLRPSMGATPQPSCTLPHYEENINTGRLFVWVKSLHEADFVLHLSHGKERVGGGLRWGRGWDLSIES
jgi:hypothetical protein